MQDLGCACITPQGVTLPEDAVRWEAHRIHNEQLWEESQRRRGWSAAWLVMRARGEESPSEPESSGGDVEEEDEDEEEGEVTPPPHSSPLEDLPSLSNLFSQQAGISVGMRWPKQPRTDTGASFGLPS
jgi:hypothetical protein